MARKSKSYYDLLGISPTANEDEIRHAFRSLAFKYHPDSKGQNGSETLFYRLVEAYETLRDTEKRKQYDLDNGFAKREHFCAFSDSPPESDNTKSSLKSSFDSDNSWDALREKAGAVDVTVDEGDVFQRKASRAKQQTQVLKRNKEGFFERATRKAQKLFRKQASAVRSKPTKGPSVAERGKRSIAEQLRGERFYSFTIDALESIVGTTRELVLGDLVNPVKATVAIPAGIKNGEELKTEAVDGTGSKRVVKIRIEIRPHPLIDREGDNVIMKLPLTLLEALEGVEVEVPTIEGPIKIKIPQALANDTKLRVKGRGIRNQRTGVRGDLFVKPFIMLPDRIDEETRRTARRLDAAYSCPPRALIPKNLRDLK